MSAAPHIEYYNAALDALQHGNSEAALQAVENALVEDARDPESWQLYILILTALGRADDAKAAEEKLRDIGISEADRIAMEAAAAMAAHDPQSAADHYRAAIEAAPGRIEFHTCLALALLDSGDADAARAAANHAIGLAPDDAHACYIHGRVHRLTGDKVTALESYTRAVALAPEMMLAIYEQGMLLAEEGRLEAALENFETYLKANPTDPSAAHAIAMVRARMSETR